MAANLKRKMKIGAGQTGRYDFHIIDAFTGAGLTKNVVVPMGRVESVALTPIGASAAAEAQLSVNNTVSGTPGTEDAAIVGSAGATTLVVTRPAGTTANLKFALWARGY